MIKYFLPLFILIACNCFGQNTITGHIISKNDKKPLPYATVFLNTTAIESSTDNAGSFTLKNVPPGEYQLLVSIIGYEDYKIPVTIKGNTNLPDIEVTPKNQVLNDVAIKAKYKLSPYYYLFKQEFFGSSIFARQCKILNPRAIIFYDTDTLGNYSAKSNDFIQIENDALGYKIKFLLNYFIRKGTSLRTYYRGESYFEEMKGSPAQEREWQKNRLECYQGSIMHLLRSILADNVKQNGYRIKRIHRENNPYFNRNGIEVDPYDIDNAIDFFGNSDNVRYHDKISDTVLSGKDILRKTDKDGLFAMTSNNGLMIEHTGNTIATLAKQIKSIPWIWHSTTTFIIFDHPFAIFDSNGIIINPASISTTGYFSEARMANLLPVDYNPAL